MAKYTDLQLLNMTSHVINAKNNCDPRYHIFLSKLVLESGVPPAACEQRIVDMARKAHSDIYEQQMGGHYAQQQRSGFDSIFTRKV